MKIVFKVVRVYYLMDILFFFFLLKHRRSCVFPCTRVAVSNSIISQGCDRFVTTGQSCVAKLDG